jgi:hypothetical protein
MDPEINYKIVLEFDSFSKVGFFLQDLENWQAWKEKRAEQKQNDQRGKHTKMAHQRARAYQIVHPHLPYIECFRSANMRI